MKWRLSFKKHVVFLYMVLLCLSSEIHALPISIDPEAYTSLPTKVQQGGMVNALYTITNLSGKHLLDPSCEFYLGQFVNILIFPNCNGSMV